MSIRSMKPSSVDGIKRLAKRIKAQENLPHSKALDEAARLAGFQNFIDAKRRLNRAADAAARRASPNQTMKGYPMPLAEFHQKSRTNWDDTIDAMTGPGSPSTMVWKGRRAIAAALEPFMGQSRNHAHFPTGGGHDFLAVNPSAERGCLEFKVSEGIAYVMKPRSLTLERIDGAPGNSFLLLELDELEPSGVYDRDEDEDDEEDADSADRGSEELLELAPGEYVDRGIWDRGFLGYDEDGREIPIPADARIVVRWFRGKVLFVATGSLWNGDPGTYDGRHDKMSAAQIRRLIERSLTAVEA